MDSNYYLCFGSAGLLFDVFVLDRRTRRTDLLVDADEGTIEPESSQVMAE
jgi:hypothetical protein